MKSQHTKDSQNVNLLDLLVYLASKWKWFLLSVVVCCSVAWLKYARTPLTYFRTVTVIMNGTDRPVCLDLKRYAEVLPWRVATDVLSDRRIDLTTPCLQLGVRETLVLE